MSTQSNPPAWLVYRSSLHDQFGTFIDQLGSREMEAFLDHLFWFSSYHLEAFPKGATRNAAAANKLALFAVHTQDTLRGLLGAQRDQSLVTS